MDRVACTHPKCTATTEPVDVRTMADIGEPVFVDGQWDQPTTDHEHTTKPRALWFGRRVVGSDATLRYRL